jgi:hypothetical protein
MSLPSSKPEFTSSYKSTSLTFSVCINSLLPSMMFDSHIILNKYKCCNQIINKLIFKYILCQNLNRQCRDHLSFLNPLQSRLEKFLQPGHQGILNAHRATELFCSKSWCNKGIKWKGKLCTYKHDARKQILCLIVVYDNQVWERL